VYAKQGGKFHQFASGKAEQALDQDKLQKFDDNQCDATTTRACAHQRWIEL
jgi:hypothetical protein